MLHKTTAHYWGGGQDGTDTAVVVLRNGRKIKFFKKEPFPWGFSLSPLCGAADIVAGEDKALPGWEKGFSTTFGSSTGTEAANPEMSSYGPVREKEG